MATLRFPSLDDFSPEDRAILDRLSKRMGRQPEDVVKGGVFGAQARWPALLEANHIKGLYGYRLQGALPQIAKEAMHVGIAMANKCDY